MEEDGEGSGVSGQDDDLGDTAVEGLGCFVGALLQLAVVRGLLDEVENVLGEGGVTVRMVLALWGLRNRQADRRALTRRARRRNRSATWWLVVEVLVEL